MSNSVETIKAYAIRQEFKTPSGTLAFGGHIYARDAEEAEHLADLIGATYDGEMVESICANCKRIEVYNDFILDKQDFDG